MSNKFHTVQLLIGLLVAGFLFSSCSENADLPPAPSGVQAYSLLGDTLYTPQISSEDFDLHNENLLQAVLDYRIDPEDADVLIWLGRRTAYLGEYREAVRIFTEGIYKHPADPRMYRHRGHRYLTLRMFDMALSDFRNAENLMKNMADRIEPDGLPNSQGIPTSTLKSNVWYHMGLAHYVKGDFHDAIDTYEKALELELSDDMKVALLYWHYMALKREGKDEQAGRIIAPVNEDMEVLENDVYLTLLLVFNGIFDADRLTEQTDDSLHNATLGYGLGNWHYINGRQDRAYEIWQNIYDNGEWPAFGFIAAEAELARR